MQRIVQSKVVAHWRERDGDIMTSKDKEHLIENILRFINNFWAAILPSKSLRDANARSTFVVIRTPPLIIICGMRTHVQRSSSLGRRHWSSSSRGNDNENIFSTANGCCGSVGRVVAYETRDPRFESGQDVKIFDGQRLLWLSRFWHQRSAIRIKTSSIFFTVNCMQSVLKRRI